LESVINTFIANHSGLNDQINSFENIANQELEGIIEAYVNDPDPDKDIATLNADVNSFFSNKQTALNNLIQNFVYNHADLQPGTLKPRLERALETIPTSALFRTFVDVDALACYNRVQDYDEQVIEVPLSDFSPSPSGGTLTFSNPSAPPAEILDRFSEAKYVLASWWERRPRSITFSGSRTVTISATVDIITRSRTISATSTRTVGIELDFLESAWSKIVFVDKDERSSPRKPKLVVTGDVSNLTDPNTVVDRRVWVYIPNGILYHKRLEDRVPIR
jgi:hypothetical protein